ncbi:MAG: hypothetical protein WCP57_11840 [Bacteroidota bacterium]
MTIKEKVKDKENHIKELINEIRTHLNNNSIEFNKNPQDWAYLTILSNTEAKLVELTDYFKEIEAIQKSGKPNVG